MKLNKVIALTALAAGGMIAGGSAFGQENSVSSMATNATSKVSHWFGGGGSYADKMSQKLGLSGSQKEKVQSLFKEQHQQMSDVKQNTSLTSDEKKSKLSELRDSMDQKMQSILTPEQYQKWQKLTHTRLSMPHGTETPQGQTPPSGSPQ